MEDLLSTLGVVKQSEQASAEKILHNKIYQSVLFQSAVEPYLVENVVKAKVEGLPKLSASALRNVSREVSTQSTQDMSDVDKLALLIQERFVLALLDKETKGKNSSSSNRANIQSILHADLSSSVRRPIAAENHEERRAVKLLSMEDLKQQRRNDITNTYSYRRGSSGVPFADHKYSLNIHASMSNAPTYAEKLDEEAIASLMEEARAENITTEDAFVDVTQHRRKRTQSDFLPKSDKASPKHAQQKPKSKKVTRFAESDESEEEAEFDEQPSNILSSSSNAEATAAAAHRGKLRSRDALEVESALDQMTKKSRVINSVVDTFATSDLDVDSTVVPTDGTRRSGRVKIKPAEAPSAAFSAAAAVAGAVSSFDSTGEMVCPICNRGVEVSYSRAAKRNELLAMQEAHEAMDKHVERCSTRRRATVGATYHDNIQGVDEAVFHEKIVNTRTNNNNSGGSSSSSNGNGKSSTRNGKAVAAASAAVKKEGMSKADAIHIDSDEEDAAVKGPVENVYDDFEEEFDDIDEYDDDSRRRKRGTNRDGSKLQKNAQKSGMSKSGSGGRITKSTVNWREENDSEMQSDNDNDDENDADEEYQVNEEEEMLHRDDGSSDGSTSTGEKRVVYASDDWEDDSYVRRLQGLSEAEVETVPTEYGTEMNARTFEKLYEYQKEGCRWMFELYQEGVGGILGDEMGLGKTAQLCAHFDSLSNLQLRTNRNNRLRTNNSALFLVVCPATVLQHWLNEFRYWAPRMRSVILHSISTTGLELGGLGDAGVELVLKKLRTNRYSQGIAVITTFEGMRKHKTALTLLEWTAVCLDEGQKIRNPTADITVICKTIPAFHRMILSGTPIQNNLRELWSLFDFIYPGRLGQLDVFEAEFSTPIRIGGYLNASKLEYEIAIRCAATLQRIIKPYLLRRKKDDLALVTKLPPKTEQVLFCQISPMQKDIYLNVLSSSEVHAVLERRAVAFRAINTLRKLCNHPALMFHQGKVRWHTDGSEAAATSAAGRKKMKRHQQAEDGVDSGDESDDLEFLQSIGANTIGGGAEEGRIKWSDSGKLLVLSKVLPLWHTEGHKVLIFTQTRGMLNIIESMVRELQFNYRRLDGSTPVNKRAALIDAFNNNKNIFVMLLTTRTGGVGVSLTSANRVVVFDPDWNPMTDIQSRERAWRLGQRREVTIYRLITRGTIEEKIYQRQIFKLLLSNRILDNPKQKALFTKNDIKELFVLNDTATAANSDTRSTVSGSSSASSGRMSLPEGGHVNIHTAPVSAVREASSSSTAAAAGCSDVPIRKSLTSLEEGEVMESSSNSDAKSDVGLHFDVEEYVQQELPTKLIDKVQQTIPGEGSGSVSNNAGSVDRDRRLLAALFNGEAITSVYDHDYLESHPDSNTSGGGNRITKETATNRAMAYKVVGQKLQNIANSNATTAARNSAADARVLREVEHQLTGSEPQTFRSSTSTNSLASTGSGGGGLVFGGIGGSSSNSGSGVAFGASSSLTSRFTGHSASGGNGAFSSAALLNTMRANGTSALQAVGVVNLKNSLFSSSSSTQPRVSVQQEITNRLIAMFDDTASVYNQNPDKNGPAMYSTVYIVNRFKDLGDQYAPMFKECLRVVAVNNNGIWTKK